MVLSHQSEAPRTRRWITCFAPNPHARLRLFCFPYAGAGASVFRLWPSRLPRSVEVCAIQLPGRENRLDEPAFTEMEPLIAALVPALLPLLDRPFAIFGHSMGALIAFELARAFFNDYRLRPAHLFVSGHRAPHLPSPHQPISMLPAPQFLHHLQLRHPNGIPAAVLREQELMELVLPTLQADISLVERYTCPTTAQFDFPIKVYGGMDDDWVRLDELAAWQLHSSSSGRVMQFYGDHFFVRTHPEPLLNELFQILSP